MTVKRWETLTPEEVDGYQALVGGKLCIHRDGCNTREACFGVMCEKFPRLVRGILQVKRQAEKAKLRDTIRLRSNLDMGKMPEVVNP